MHQENRIIGLFPELLGFGGIQEAGRLTAADVEETVAKPVVAVSHGGTTDIVEDGVNGLLVPPRDTQRLVWALNRLLNDESRRMELGRRGGEIVRHKYGLEVFHAGIGQILTGDSHHPSQNETIPD